MSSVQSVQAVQAFIQGCLATKKLPASKQFRGRLQEILVLLDSEKPPVVYFSHKELDEVFKINIFVQEQKIASRAYPDFLNYCNDFLRFVFRIKMEGDFEQLFSSDFLLNKDFKGYVGFLFCDVVQPDFYNMKGESMLSLNFARKLLYFAGLEAKKVFKKSTDQSLYQFALFLIDVAIQTRLDHSLVLLRLMLTSGLNDYKFFKNEKIVKKLIASNQGLNKAYNQYRVFSFDYDFGIKFQVSVLIVDVVKKFYETKNLDAEMKQLLNEQLSEQVWYKRPYERVDTESEMKSILQQLMQDQQRFTSGVLAWELYGLQEKENVDWPKQVVKQVESLPSAQMYAYFEMWCHAAQFDQSKQKSARQKWVEKAHELYQTVEATFDHFMVEWLTWMLADDSYKNYEYLRGLIGFSRFTSHPIVPALIAKIAMKPYREDAGLSITSDRNMAAVLMVLSYMDARGILMLAWIHQALKRPKSKETVYQVIENAMMASGLTIESAAAQFGMSPKQSLAQIEMTMSHLEDARTPILDGLIDGVKTYQVGHYQASLRLKAARQVIVVWKNQDRALSAPPQTLKNHPEHAKICAQIEQDQKRLTQFMSMQCQQLEDSLLQRRTWRYDTWDDLWVKNPMFSLLSHRLIWQFETDGQIQHGFYTDGQWCDVVGQPLQQLTEQTIVRVWHPIFSTAEEVVAWRQLLVNRQIVQPFKQAFREVYLITPAEIDANHQSLRYAGHYLKQFQLKALCEARGWRYKLQGRWHDMYSPTRHLEAWDHLSVSIGVRSEVGEPQNASGVFLYVQTGAVKFYQAIPVEQDGELKYRHQQLALTDVPPLVFSEVMRDIDLFVGVCSIGTDPTLGQAQTHHQGIRDYWHQSQFAELTASAQVRKETLDMIISKLAIAPLCRFEGKYLHVTGKLRHYKIHLGSGNILMSPNDQYLCIVADHKHDAQMIDEIYLPFEGDQMLSLILSKALLLAADDQITDRSIVQQIKAA